MRVSIFLIIFVVFLPVVCLAARPLSTDDAGTVEKGHFEAEAGFEYVDDADDEYNLGFCMKYGLFSRLDIGVEVPYHFIEVSNGDDVDGIGDVSISAKLNVLEEKENIPALAISYSFKTETGDEEKGLSSGEVDHAINAILTKELGKVVGHLNLGYTYVGLAEDENDDVFSYAIALEYPVNERLNLVGELTGETNFDGEFDDNPFAGLVGFNYALSDIITFDLGFGWGISDASADFLVTSGLTLAF
ncbi:MAG: transporter [Candidatus Omnitrophica bacterium]|nr:transporter [Candidatus Omnitrophota bacterium]